MNSTHTLSLCALAGVAFFFASCHDHRNNNGETPSGEASLVQFTSFISTQADGQPSPSRVTVTAWEEGDAVGISMVATGTTTIAGDAENRKYIASAAGTSTSFSAVTDSEIYYPLTGAVDFIAYHPWKTTGTDGISSDLYPINLANQTNQSAIDLLWATANNNGKGYDETNTAAVPLTFSHRLAKLILKPVAGTDVASLSGMSVSVKGLYTTSTFNVKTGTFGTPGNVAPITPYTAIANEQYEAIILPCTVATKGDVMVEFTLGDEVFTWNVPAATAFNSNEEHTWTVTLSRVGVSATGTISEWRTGTGGTGTTE